MSFLAPVQWEVRTTGSDSNGGGFDATSGTPGTDFSQQDAAQIAYTDLVIDGATNTKCTSAAHPFTSAHVGNIINVTGGTGFTVQRVQIISVAASAATVDKSLGTLGSTGGTGNLGGALATLGTVAGIAVTGNVAWVRSGTYSISASIDTGTSWGNYRIEGYQTTRGDLGTKPIIRTTAAVTAVKLRCVGSGVYNVFRNFDVDGNSATGTQGIDIVSFNQNSSVAVDLCKVHNFSAAGIFGNQTPYLLKSEFYSNAIGAGDASTIWSVIAVGCIFRNNSSYGARRMSDSRFVGCKAYSNGTGGTGFGFDNGGTGFTHYLRCVAYNNSGSGFGSDIANNRVTKYFSCISYGNSGYGFDQTTSDGAEAINCATGSNSSGAFNNVLNANRNNVALSADPFLDAANGNFDLNSIIGGGLSCKLTGYLSDDIGAGQHQDHVSDSVPVTFKLSAV